MALGLPHPTLQLVWSLEIKQARQMAAKYLRDMIDFSHPLPYRLSGKNQGNAW